MVDYTLLKKLCLADGISGDESAVRDIIVDEIKDHAEWRVDSLGNLLVHKKGKAPAVRAHGRGRAYGDRHNLRRLP